MTFTILTGTPLCRRSFKSVSLSTLSNAFSKSIKLVYRGEPNSLDCSMMIRSLLLVQPLQLVHLCISCHLLWCPSLYSCQQLSILSCLGLLGSYSAVVDSCLFLHSHPYLAKCFCRNTILVMVFFGADPLLTNRHKGLLNHHLSTINSLVIFHQILECLIPVLNYGPELFQFRTSFKQPMSQLVSA